MKKRPKPWYRKTGMKHVTGFLSPKDKERLRGMAKAVDMSLTRYVSRLLERHLEEREVKKAERW